MDLHAPSPARPRTFLKNTQSRIDKGHLRLEDILGLKASKGGSRGGGRSKHPEGVIDGLEEALRHSGTLAQVCCVLAYVLCWDCGAVSSQATP